MTPALNTIHLGDALTLLRAIAMRRIRDEVAQGKLF